MDATLSINRQYNRFVIPRLEYFKVNFPEVNSLNKLSTLIDEKGIYGFNVVWNYNHPKRVEILRDLTQFFLNNKKLVEIENDLDSMQKWAREVDISSGNFLPVSGIGFTTGQYIRKLFSVDTVKPDVHIKKAIFDGTGIKLSEMKAVLLIEDTANIMSKSAKELDYAIWKHYSLK